MKRIITFIDLANKDLMSSKKALARVSQSLFLKSFMTCVSVINTKLSYQETVELIGDLYADFEIARAKQTAFRELDVYLYDKSNLEKIIQENQKSIFIDHEFTNGLGSNLFEKPNWMDCPEVSESNHGILGVKSQSGKELSVDCFGNVAVAGTFNYLHSGHKLLLSAAALLSNQIFVGISSDALLKKKNNAELIEPFEIRKAIVNQFMERFKKDAKFDYWLVESSETGSDKKNLEALVVTKETEPGLGRFADKRKELGLAPVEAVILDVVESQDKEANAKISSSSTRALIADKSQGFANVKIVKEALLDSVIFFSKVISREEVETMFSQIALLYSESHRYYHTLEHIAECLLKLKTLFTCRLKPEELHVLSLALIFHDVIYIPSSKTNEEDSAEYFNSLIGQLLDPHTRTLVSDLILSTKSHKPNPANKLESIMIDIDMSILTESPDRYLRYAVDVRKEYIQYPDEVYKSLRKAFLESLADKKVFVHDDIFKMDALRANVETEINKLLQ